MDQILIDVDSLTRVVWYWDPSRERIYLCWQVEHWETCQEEYGSINNNKMGVQNSWVDMAQEAKENLLTMTLKLGNIIECIVLWLTLTLSKFCRPIYLVGGIFRLI
jgi:hypothetical protein